MEYIENIIVSTTFKTIFKSVLQSCEYNSDKWYKPEMTIYKITKDCEKKGDYILNFSFYITYNNYLRQYKKYNDDDYDYEDDNDINDIEYIKIGINDNSKILDYQIHKHIPINDYNNENLKLIIKDIYDNFIQLYFEIDKIVEIWLTIIIKQFKTYINNIYNNNKNKNNNITLRDDINITTLLKITDLTICNYSFDPKNSRSTIYFQFKYNETIRIEKLNYYDKNKDEIFKNFISTIDNNINTCTNIEDSLIKKFDQIEFYQIEKNIDITKIQQIKIIQNFDIKLQIYKYSIEFNNHNSNSNTYNYYEKNENIMYVYYTKNITLTNLIDKLFNICQLKLKIIQDIKPIIENLFYEMMIEQNYPNENTNTNNNLIEMFKIDPNSNPNSFEITININLDTIQIKKIFNLNENQIIDPSLLYLYLQNIFRSLISKDKENLLNLKNNATNTKISKQQHSYSFSNIPIIICSCLFIRYIFS
jgi:hypothetical protein